MATSDWLLLRLPAHAGEAPHWAAADSTGAVMPLFSPDAPAMAAGRHVAVIVPAGEVALFHAALPAGNEARLQQLAPFALEEQVSEDLDDLHFAVGARDATTGLAPVAVVDRERLRHWLAEAGRLGVTPRSLFAESDLAPELPGHVTLLVTPDHYILRQDRGRPVALPAEDVELALLAVLGAEADLSAIDLAVYASPDDWPRHQADIEALRDRVASLRVQLSSGGLSLLLAQGLTQGAPVNLLQGEFKPQAATGPGWQRWRVAAALLAGLLVLQAGASLWEVRQLRRTSAQLDESIARVYGTIFPGQQPGRAPRRALEARLGSLSGGTGAAGELMPLLAALAAARQNVPVATLNAITYKPGSLQLRLSAPDAATLEQFSQALRAGGFTAQVSSGSQRDGHFEGQIDLGT